MLTPASGGKCHSPDMSRYICATRSGNVAGTCSPSASTFTGWQSRCVSMTTLCFVNRTADGRVPSAGLMIRTGRPRSNSFPEAESKSRTASAVAGRLPTWMMSSGFALSARSTMSAAVTSRIGEPSGPSDATPCRAFGFRTGQASARRRFRNHGGCIMRIEQT